MYGNNFTYPGAYDARYNASYPSNPAYTSAPAQYGAPTVPNYVGQFARPVHRRVTPPDTMFGGNQQYRRPSVNLPDPSAHRGNPDRFAPLPLNHYVQQPPTVLHNPFYIRSSSPDPLHFEYTSDEVNLLRSAGFRNADRQRLAARPDAHFRFVMRNAEWLAEHGFTPDDMLSTARLSPSQRQFVARKVCSLDRIGFYPSDINDLAIMSERKRNFVLTHGADLRATGFSPLQMMLLASRPAEERQYVVVYGVELRERGYAPAEIHRQARNPALRPDMRPRLLQPATDQRNALVAPRQAAGPSIIVRTTDPSPALPPPRRVSTSEVPRRQRAAALPPGADINASRSGRTQTGQPPRRRTTTSGNALTAAEREGFLNIGLSQEALDRLARSNSTVRAYLLAHGGNLLASGMAFDEIIAMAEDSSVAVSSSASTRQRQARSTHTRETTADELVQNFSRLSTTQVNQDRWLADIPTTAPRTASPEPIVAPRTTYPRNHAMLDATQRAALDHAYTRWSYGHLTRASGEEFYRDTVPLILVQKMAEGDDHPNLRLLLAGVPYAEDNRHQETAQRHRERVKAVTDYLTSTDDPELLRNCDSAAAEGVTHCGDRVAYGLTRVEQTVMQRKIQHGEIPPRTMFESIESVFLQPRVENIAAYLANARKARNGLPATHANFTSASFAAQLEQAADANFTRTRGSARTQLFSAIRSTLFGGPTVDNSVTVDNSASESLEMYAALAPLLIRHGIHLVESARHSTYGGMYHVEPLEIEYALNEINRHVRDGSDEFLQEFEGNAAVETILRRRFQEDFRSMRAEREELQDQADEALFDADAPPGTQETVRDTMAALATMEKEWYREKLKVMLAQRHLLDNLPPLAPDLAAD